MSAFERAKHWWRVELSILAGEALGPNEYDPYVPIEARNLSAIMRENGVKPPAFTNRHFKLWAALTQVLGKDEYTEPLGWEAADINTHLLGL